MLVTKEQQERIIEKYAREHNAYEYMGFVDGLNATLELIERISKNERL